MNPTILKLIIIAMSVGCFALAGLALEGRAQDGVFGAALFLAGWAGFRRPGDQGPAK